MIDPRDALTRLGQPIVADLDLSALQGAVRSRRRARQRLLAATALLPVMAVGAVLVAGPPGPRLEFAGPGGRGLAAPVSSEPAAARVSPQPPPSPSVSEATAPPLTVPPPSAASPAPSSSSSVPSPGPSAPTSPAGRPPVPAPEASATAPAETDVRGGIDVFLQAEDGVVEPLMERVADGTASAGAFVEVADETDLDALGSTTLSFALPQAGSYRVWARVRTPAQHRNSFRVRMDGGDDVDWRIRLPPDPSAWTWVQVPLPGGTNGGSALAAGPHVLTFFNREDGTALDCVLVTDDLAASPEGTQGVLNDQA